ncbi:MAG: peptidyl-prolyl cis-trans isomerase, partial [Betaproteobacteria bacterium]|nr:peptidyl-prolyl cis-trans isomerase [Betaproteobacteria bacterium]
PVPDLNSAAREEFLVNPHRFKYPAHYRLWHTLLRYETDTKSVVQEKANKVRDMVLKGGAIDKIAKEYSDDLTAQSNGGTNPAVPLESVNPALRPVVEKMKAGDVSSVLDVGTGFFVVKLVELIPERVPKFDEIKLDLIQDARVSFLGTYYKQYIEDIKTDKTLKIDAQMLDNVRKPYLPNLDLIQKPAPKKT